MALDRPVHAAEAALETAVHGGLAQMFTPPPPPPILGVSHDHLPASCDAPAAAHRTGGPLRLPGAHPLDCPGPGPGGDPDRGGHRRQPAGQAHQPPSLGSTRFGHPHLDGLDRPDGHSLRHPAPQPRHRRIAGLPRHREQRRSRDQLHRQFGIGVDHLHLPGEGGQPHRHQPVVRLRQSRDPGSAGVDPGTHTHSHSDRHADTGAGIHAGPRGSAAHRPDGQPGR